MNQKSKNNDFKTLILFLCVVHVIKSYCERLIFVNIWITSKVNFKAKGIRILNFLARRLFSSQIPFRLTLVFRISNYKCSHSFPHAVRTISPVSVFDKGGPEF